MEGDSVLWGNWSEVVEVKTQQSGKYTGYCVCHASAAKFT